MRFAVVGAGAIGGYLGARLALAGHEVVLIARNRNLEAIRAGGFKLIEEDGRERVARAVRAEPRMADAGPQDAVLLTVKAHQVHELLPDLRALFGPQTMLVTMINGVPWWYFQRLGGPWEGRRLDSVDPGGRQWDGLGPERVIGCVVYPACEVVGVAVNTQTTAVDMAQNQVGLSVAPVGQVDPQGDGFGTIATLPGRQCTGRPIGTRRGRHEHADDTQ